MKKKKKKLDELFESYSFSDTSFSSLFFREDAIEAHKKSTQSDSEKQLDELFDASESTQTFVAEESVLEETEEVTEVIEEEVTVLDEDEEVTEVIEEEVTVLEEAEEVTEVIEEEVTVLDETEEVTEVIEEEVTVLDETEEVTEVIEEEVTVLDETEEVTEVIEEEVTVLEEDEEAVKTDDKLDEDPEVLAAKIAAAILAGTDFVSGENEASDSEDEESDEEDFTEDAVTSEVTDKNVSEEESEEDVSAEEAVNESTAASDDGAEHIEEIKAPKREKVPKEKKPKREKPPKEKRKKIFVMGSPDIPEDSRLPSDMFRRVAGRKRSTVFVSVCYIAFLSVVVALLSMCTTKLIDIYDSADPEKVVTEYVEYLSGTPLYNDVVLGVGELKSEYESEKDASGKVLDILHTNSEKNYHRVSYGDSYISYDVYAGDSKIYNLVLSKKAEANSIIDISFWEVKEVSFYAESLNAFKKKFYISAPADAMVALNGVPLTKDMITDSNYKFFIGSVWESETPEEARCVLYEVDGIFGDPTFTASYGEEALEMYVDEDGVYHAKYPKGWVKDYTVSVPKGSALYINGVLATKVSSSGSAPATPFEGVAEGLTDIYVIESLFNDPELHAYFDGLPLGDYTREGDSYSFPFSEAMYRKAEIVVPKGASVKVNGVALTGENSSCTPLLFSEWSKDKLTVNSYMPSELRSFGFEMPEFERHTVSMLYFSPTVEVTLDGAVCTPYSAVNGGTISTFKYDYPSTQPASSFVTFAESFSKTYLKYMTEGCYGIRDDVEMRKNFYTNWLNFLSYILPDTLCYDSALESYSDVEYRPNLKILSESYTVQNVIRYSDSIYTCSVVCSIKDTGSDSEVITVLNMLIVLEGGQYKIWMHDTIS